jgi:hypothetical protein
VACVGIPLISTIFISHCFVKTGFFIVRCEIFAYDQQHYAYQFDEDLSPYLIGLFGSHGTENPSILTLQGLPHCFHNGALCFQSLDGGGLYPVLVYANIDAAGWRMLELLTEDEGKY